jgi:hypothetical protein
LSFVWSLLLSWSVFVAGNQSATILWRW